MLRAFFLFMKAWLLMAFVCAFFIAPLYLIAIFPEVPDPMVRALRGVGYGVVHAPASEATFWYRLASCGVVIVIGCAMVYAWVKGHRAPQTSRRAASVGKVRASRTK